MKSVWKQRFQTLKISTLYYTITGLILFNLVYGPLVRATDSGLACPDWPLCHGKFVPEWTFQIFMEVGHRYYSGALGLIVFAGFIFIIKDKARREKLGALALLSMVLLASQVTLGALTVTKLLNPSTVNLHLLNAIALLKVCYTIAKISSEKQDFKWSYQTPGNILLTLGAFLIGYQIILGGKVSSNYAGLACPDFPLCYGSWFPEMVGTIRYQMEHRWFAYIVSAYVLGTSAYSIFKWENTETKFYLKIASYLVVLQVVVGALNVIYLLPKFLTAFHTLNAVFVFLAYYTACFHQFRTTK